MTTLDIFGVATPPHIQGRTLAGVALFDPPGHSPGNLHDQDTRRVMISRLATLLRLPDLGVVTEPDGAGADVLLMPRDTLISEGGEGFESLSMQTLLGGLAPARFVATKAITHGLVHETSPRPTGWSTSMAERLADAALEGYTAFTPEDAMTAGERLLGLGPVRIKEVCAKAGLSQEVVRDADALADAIGRQDPTVLADCGLVLEENLEDVVTYSVGALTLGGLRISYVGDQQLTTDRKGREVYGGSTLRSVRGGFERLKHLGLSAEETESIACAAVFDDAARRAYPGLVLTRRNYDVIAGRDARGRRRVGVLEQSWRVGGATGAEIAALEAFAQDPALTSVTTATVERYALAEPPPAAVIYFRGVDPVTGPMTKYAVRLG